MPIVIDFNWRIDANLHRQRALLLTFAFDLWDVDDVRSNADAILGRLRQGTMPCDGGWSSEHVELFGRWIATGKLD